MRILIENLTFETIIGILENERITPQTVVVDCIIGYTYTENHFINYAQVAHLIETTMQKEQFFLIEEALEYVTLSLKNQFQAIQELSLTIRKPNILANCSVGVQKQFFF